MPKFDTNNLKTVIWFQVFLPNTNNLYTISSNYSNLTIIICFFAVIWFQVFSSNTNNFQTEQHNP